ncbi:cytochrome bd-I ubiquinol oxidase subunit 2 apoprotein [Microbacteriaceae bacterium MWH-Ta3]|nr:cytochrome bd-I ubiquinol oxidase subunit 2 apoprotein [Microbacteriaceae bacterium MWH-Ta3]
MDLSYLWFGIVGFFFIGYFILDGFDFGVGMSLPFVARNNEERRVVINTIGPVWDLNETWVIVGGASLFAAFPMWYATLFSGFYLALLLILISLILRGVSFEYRHQGKGAKWTGLFDTFIIIGSVVPALLWGVAFANIIQGVPIDENGNFTGSLLTLLNPYGLLGGVVTLALFFMHGLIYLALKSEGEIRDRARSLAVTVGLVAVPVGGGWLLWTVLQHASVSHVLVIVAFALLTALALVAAILLTRSGADGKAFAAMAMTIAFAVLTILSALFPNVMPSSTDAAYSLTIENASSSTYTLTVMTWVAAFALPIVLAYQAWTFWIFRKRVTVASIPVSAH